MLRSRSKKTETRK